MTFQVSFRFVCIRNLTRKGSDPLATVLESFWDIVLQWSSWHARGQHINHILCARLLMNWRPRVTQYFCQSCVSVSLTPLWSTCMCAARANNLVKCSFLGSCIGNLDWSSRETLSNFPRHRRTALSSRYKRSWQTCGRDSLMSFQESCCISRLKAWPWKAFVQCVMAIDSSWAVRGPVLRSFLPETFLTSKHWLRLASAQNAPWVDFNVICGNLTWITSFFIVNLKPTDLFSSCSCLTWAFTSRVNFTI